MRVAGVAGEAQAGGPGVPSVFREGQGGSGAWIPEVQKQKGVRQLLLSGSGREQPSSRRAKFCFDGKLLHSCGGKFIIRSWLDFANTRYTIRIHKGLRTVEIDGILF